MIQDAVFGLAARLRPGWLRCSGADSLVPLGTQLSEGPALPGRGSSPTGPGRMGIQQESLGQGRGGDPQTTLFRRYLTSG